MRKLMMLGAVAMLAFGAVGTARAALLNYQGSLTLELGDLPELGSSGGGVATVNSSGGGIPAHLATLQLKQSRGIGIAGTQMVPITDPEGAAQGIAAVHVTATVGTGTLSPISGAANSSSGLVQNTVPVRGLAKVCLISTICTKFLGLELTQHTGTVVKGAGIGGVLQIDQTGPNAIHISIEAAPWTIKTRTSIDQISTPMTGTLALKKYITKKHRGFAHDPASTTTNTANPASGGGVVQLITPMQVRTNLTLGSSLKLGLFGFLTIKFIPEPGMLLLLGSGVAGLVLLGRHRMRK